MGEARFETLRLGDQQTHIYIYRLQWKQTENVPDVIFPSILDSDGWINKSLFRIVFGEGIVPGVQPLGP